MILEGIINFVFGAVGLIIDALPDVPVPGWLDDGSGLLSSLWASGAGLGAWLPWSTIGTVFGAIMASVVVGFTIKVVRLVASYFTGGGGSAA